MVRNTVPHFKVSSGWDWKSASSTPSHLLDLASAAFVLEFRRLRIWFLKGISRFSSGSSWRGHVTFPPHAGPGGEKLSRDWFQNISAKFRSSVTWVEAEGHRSVLTLCWTLLNPKCSCRDLSHLLPLSLLHPLIPSSSLLSFVKYSIVDWPIIHDNSLQRSAMNCELKLTLHLILVAESNSSWCNKKVK